LLSCPRWRGALLQFLEMRIEGVETRDHGMAGLRTFFSLPPWGEEYEALLA